MSVGEVFQVALAVVGSVGTGGLIVYGLSSYLGKIWATRLVAELESKLRVDEAKTIGAHSDKLAAYRAVADILAEILTDLTAPHRGAVKIDLVAARERFERERLRTYGYLAMLAPQSVMDAHDSLMDFILAELNKEQAATWTEMRSLALTMLNAIRVDLGIDPTPITYTGSR